MEQSIKDIENPTEQEVLSVVEYFMTTATSLTVVDDVLLEQTEVEELEPVQKFDDVTGDVDNIQDIDSSDLYTGEDVQEAIAPPNTPEELEKFYQHPALFTPNTTNTNPTPAPLATTTQSQSQLITTTAEQMGIVLDASEISLIAENINNSSDDFDQDIDAIKSAIMAFISHKAMLNQSKINELINEVREAVGAKNSENSQLLSEGLRSINQDIQEANKQFKSNVKTCLSAFDIPALKAS